MNISSFNEGDLITRCEAVKYGTGVNDGSYMGDKFHFVGVDEPSKIIVLLPLDSYRDGLITLSYGRDAWDEGWAYYPDELVNKSQLTK